MKLKTVNGRNEYINSIFGFLKNNETVGEPSQVEGGSDHLEVICTYAQLFHFSTVP